MKYVALCTAMLAAAASSPAHATDEAFEMWINPAVTVAIDDRTETEFESIARLRSSEDNRVDTYYVRLWLGRKLGENATLGVAVEQRWNGTQEETRLHQQFSLSLGILRSRTRLEQRFVEGDPDTGWRVRQRTGVEVPFDRDERWSGVANWEGFFTIEPTRPGGQTGLTAHRSYAGVEYAASERLTLGLGYLRAQEVRIGRADVVGHAPVLAATFAF